MMLEAFDILDLFVELLLSRAEMLKMQTNCPFDLREAVCTVIYVAPRIDAKVTLISFFSKTLCVFDSFCSAKKAEDFCWFVLRFVVWRKQKTFVITKVLFSILLLSCNKQKQELTEVRSQFIEKYGKPFASEAMENKGGCVNAKIIHKMSIITPDNATVFEYLASIAKGVTKKKKNSFCSLLLSSFY
jgi:hypothetical protein